MFGRDKKYNYKNPYAEKTDKKFFLQNFLGKKETTEEKKARLATEYELNTLEAKTLRSKNTLQREKNQLKKLSESMGTNSNTPDYLGLYSKPSRKSKDPFEDLGNFKF